MLAVPATAHAGSHRHPHHAARHVRAASSDPRPSAWCGWWLRRLYGIADKRLNLAINWRRFGRPAGGPAPGVIGVQPHHVFKVLAVVAPGAVLAISGNDSHSVRTRVRSTRNVVAWRAP
jgi:hypothetical protein